MVRALKNVLFECSSVIRIFMMLTVLDILTVWKIELNLREQVVDVSFVSCCDGLFEDRSVIRTVILGCRLEGEC